MAGKQTIKGEEAVRYLKTYPDRPLLWIAKLMHKEEPKMFPAVESTRRLLREYVGSGGSANTPRRKYRSLAPDKYGTRREKGVAGGDAWRQMMPESVAEPFEPYVLPKSITKLLVMGDLHVPWHNPEAIEMAIQYGIDEKVDGVLLNGDVLDFYGASDHEKDPRKVNWMGEIEAGRAIFRMIRQAFPGIPITFVVGNHSYRLERYLMKYADLLLGMPEFELPTLMRLGELGIHTVPNKRVVHAGKLTIAHGDNWKGGGGINPARWISLKTGEPTMINHFHRTSSHMDRTVRGNIRGWWSLGCLCELTPTYLPMNSWNLGFAVVHINKDGSFEVDNKMIVEGKVR